MSDITVPQGAGPAATVSVRSEAFEVESRIPTSRDVLAAVGAGGDVATVRRRLLDRCVVTARRGSEPIGAAALPETVEAELVRRIAEADAQAEVHLALACPACGRPWVELFDVLSYFWAEIDAWADRLLRDVHDLASAYGWGEAEILAMSPLRRRRYLAMVGA